MITSKQIFGLLETYEKAQGKIVIYSNPDKSDLIKLRKAAEDKLEVMTRFTADANTRKLYVWDGYIALHAQARSMLGLPTEYQKTPWLINGLNEIVRVKLTCPNILDLDMLSPPMSNPNHKIFPKVEVIKFYKELFSYNWDWVNTYISGFTNVLNKDVKAEYNRALQ